VQPYTATLSSAKKKMQAPCRLHEISKSLNAHPPTLKNNRDDFIALLSPESQQQLLIASSRACFWAKHNFRESMMPMMLNCHDLEYFITLVKGIWMGSTVLT
jgi:hypothetical protein